MNEEHLGTTQVLSKETLSGGRGDARGLTATVATVSWRIFERADSLEVRPSARTRTSLGRLAAVGHGL